MKKLPRNYEDRDGVLFYKGHNLTELAEKYKTPLRIKDPMVLVDNYAFLRELVDQEMDRVGLTKDKFATGYAIKANQDAKLVSLACENTDFLEVSSANDLILIRKIGHCTKDKLIVCHGFKTKQTKFFTEIVEMINDGFNILPILDSVDEIEDFISLNQDIKVGIRVASRIVHNNNLITERFGITLDEILENVPAIQNSKLDLSMLSIHVGGTIRDVKQRLSAMESVFKAYKKINSQISIPAISIGGGLPSRSETDSEVYKSYFREVIKRLLEDTTIDEFPVIYNESGRFFAAETQLLVLEVLLEKSNNSGFDWYVLNGSSINLIPEKHLDSNYTKTIIPANGRKRNTKLVLFAGITCDPEDYYVDNFVEMPILQSNDRLFVVIPDTGAYQESLSGSGRNNPGHCLIDDAKSIVLENNSFVEQDIDINFPRNLGYS